LGVVLEERANDIHAEIISRPESKVEVRVIATDEESVVARHSRKVMQA
ncbi:acetate kinase, partial [Mesorhizobium sp. M7A.T.Ca.TU.009.01.3.2]